MSYFLSESVDSIDLLKIRSNYILIDKIELLISKHRLFIKAEKSLATTQCNLNGKDLDVETEILKYIF